MSPSQAEIPPDDSGRDLASREPISVAISGKRERLPIVVGVVLLAGNIALWGWVGQKYYTVWAEPERLDGDSFASTADGEPSPYNGFDVSNAIVSSDRILRGGPPRDGIPAITDPKFVSVAEVDYLGEEDEVLGIVIDGMAKAYPLRILVYHEIVNDTVGGQQIMATYCPLCGTCMVFDRAAFGEPLTFGVSGLLYNSDVLMYDHQTESLWSQLMSKAVSGPMTGSDLDWMPSVQMTWAAWKIKHPDSLVLSTDTGFPRNYAGAPYAGYEDSDQLMFPVDESRTELDNKTMVLGILVDDTAKAYPINVLESLAGEPIQDSLGGEDIQVTFDPASGEAHVTLLTDQTALPNVKAYWFAWQAFHPETLLYEPGG